MIIKFTEEISDKILRQPMAATSFIIKTGVTFCQVFSCAVICCIGLHTYVSDTVMRKSDMIW